MLQRHEGENKAKTIYLFLAFGDTLPLASQHSGPYILWGNYCAWLA